MNIIFAVLGFISLFSAVAVLCFCLYLVLREALLEAPNEEGLVRRNLRQRRRQEHREQEVGHWLFHSIEAFFLRLEDDIGPRLWGSKSEKEIVHNHQAALSKITIFIREASGRFAAQKVQQCPKESEEVTVTTLVPYPSGVRECDQGIEKLCSSTVSPSGLVDCDISVKDSENEDSDAVPMYVKHTEAMLDEIDRMKEVEESEEPTMLDEIDRMKEVEESEDPFMEFDSSFMKDPLSVVEYVDDNYALCRKTENQSCVSPSDMAQQQDINEKMRAILIDWFIEVYDKFEVMDETLFLTINLIDRLLERQVVVRKKLQLVGVTAMLLACKYEVVSVPLMEDFVLISDKAYTRQDVLDMEKSLVNKLQFNFSVPTPYVFIRRFLKAAQSDKKIEVLSFLIALCLVEYEMLKYPLSLLAAAAIYTARCSLSRFKQWHTNYLEDELQLIKNYIA